jgi:glycosyltransferase involved in cell wall biosynthesis
MTMPEPILRALLVSYAFPPVGGAGVQRVLKLVKYLPLYGVVPSVLTVENPSVPLRDASLERDVAPSTEILRAPTLEPSYSTKQLAWNVAAVAPLTLGARIKQQLLGIGRKLLVPDPQALWLPHASRTLAARLLSSRAEDVVFISGPPFSQFLLGYLGRLRPATAVVLDYRDEWTTTRGVYEMGNSIRAGAVLERAILRRAHAVTTATEAFRSQLLERFEFLDERHVHVIPNGYDRDDFPSPLPSPSRDKFVLTYLGTVFRLTSPRGLLEAVRLLHEREPALAALLDLRFIGRIVETEAALFTGTDALGVRRLGYLDHEQATGELARSHAVLCLLSDVPGAERIYPAKIFEIMYLGRPCLALTPEGELATLVRRHRLGDVVPPGNRDAILAWLIHRLEAFRRGTSASPDVPVTHAVDIERFDRKIQAGDFARVFRSAARRAQENRLTRTTLQRSVHDSAGGSVS